MGSLVGGLKKVAGTAAAVPGPATFLVRKARSMALSMALVRMKPAEVVLAPAISPINVKIY